MAHVLVSLVVNSLTNMHLPLKTEWRRLHLTRILAVARVDADEFSVPFRGAATPLSANFPVVVPPALIAAITARTIFYTLPMKTYMSPTDGVGAA